MNYANRQAANEARLISATQLLRLHVQERFRPGDELPAAPVLADLVGLPEAQTRMAMQRLDTEGVVAKIAKKTWLLGPDEQHPLDIALDLSVRERIASGLYRAGQALPVGILGTEHRLTVPQVERACRRLVAQGLLRRDTAGPYGPGLYVAAKDQPSQGEAR